ncbi:glucodextranase DOMON-like domain-containing protein [Oceanithermus sp.]
MNWILLALLLFSDPVGDDHGAGLGYPRAAIYQEVGFADITGFELKRQDGRWLLGIKLARYPNPAEAPLGFSLATIAVYLDTEPGGEESLPGAGLKTPPGGGWEEAYLISGWGAERRTPAGKREPARAWREGDWIWVQTDLSKRPNAYVASGIYDPFEPWAFRKALPGGGVWYLDGPENSPRALDVVASDQEEVWASGILPPVRRQRSWKPLLALALLLAGSWFLYRAWRNG